MTSDQFMSWLKSTLAILGGVLTTTGVTSGTTWATATGVILSIAPFVWGFLSNTALARVQSVANLPGVSKVVIRDTAPPELVAAAVDTSTTNAKIKTVSAP